MTLGDMYENFDEEHYEALETKQEKKEYLMRLTAPGDSDPARITNGQLLRVQQILAEALSKGVEPMREQLVAVERFLLAVLYDTDRKRGSISYTPEQTWDALDRLPILAGGAIQPRSGQGGKLPTLQRLVDSMIDRACSEHPGVDYSVHLSAADSLLLPKHSGRLRRDGGAYTGVHVYRDCLVEGLGGDDVVALVALNGVAPTYYGILATGEVTTRSPHSGHE